MAEELITHNNNIKNSDNKTDNGLNNEIKSPIWLSVSEAAKIGGVQAKTIRRTIQYNKVKYKIIGNRYAIDFSSLVAYLNTKTKLKNKLNQFGLGQYVDKWK
jgi:excisionase family DNA binding protein